jgi:hypothetical protein
MSTTPPEQPPVSPPPASPPPHAGYTGLGRTPVTGAILPVPGNAELAVWILVEIVLAIVAGVSDRFDAHDWAVATTWLTAAYIISRGIAKASRVLEQ